MAKQNGKNGNGKGSMTVARRPEPHGARCGALKRQGPGSCTQAAGWGTDHAGQGRCKLHGGATPIASGRYSTITRQSIRELQEFHAKQPNPLGTDEEIALVRALLTDYINRYEENNAAILGWWASWSASQRPLSEERVMAFERIVDDFEEQLRLGKAELTERQEEALELARAFITDLRNPDNSRPRQLLDISDAYQMAAEVTRMVERVEKTRAANAVSRPELLRILSEMGRVVDLFVADPQVREKIRDAWSEFRL